MSDSRNQLADKHLWQIVAVREFLIVSVFGILLWLVYILRDTLLPVFIALVLADVFNPSITFLQTRWHWPRSLTAALIVAIFVASVIGFLAWLGPLLARQFYALADRLPEYLSTLAKTYNLDFSDVIKAIDKSIRSLQSEPRKILGQLFSTTNNAMGILAAIFTTASNVIVSFALVVISFFFFAWRFNSGLDKLKNFLPRKRREQIFQIGQRIDQAVGDFFRGRLLIALMVGVALSFGWFLTGVPYWFFLGMLGGLLNVVPYIALVVWPVAVLLKYLDILTNSGGQSSFLTVVLWPSAVYLIVQFLDGWVLTPWVQRGQTNLSAATILIVVFVGGALAGIWGLLFAIPVAASIKILLEEIVLPRLSHWADTH